MAAPATAAPLTDEEYYAQEGQKAADAEGPAADGSLTDAQYYAQEGLRSHAPTAPAAPFALHPNKAAPNGAGPTPAQRQSIAAAGQAMPTRHSGAPPPEIPFFPAPSGSSAGDFAQHLGVLAVSDQPGSGQLRQSRAGSLSKLNADSFQASPLNYHTYHNGIIATEASLKTEAAALNQGDADLNRRARALTQEQAEILKGDQLRNEHPEEFDQDRVLRFQAKVDAHEAAVAALKTDAAALAARRQQYREAFQGYQGDVTAYKQSPASAAVPKIAPFNYAPSPPEQRFNNAAGRYQALAKGDPSQRARADQERALAATALVPTFKPRAQALAQSGQVLAQQAAALNALVAQAKAGTLSPGDERRLIQAGQAFKRAADAHDAAVLALANQRKNVAGLVRARLASNRPIHTGTEYPEEVAARAGKPEGWLEKQFHRLLEYVAPSGTAAEKQQAAVVRDLQLTGEYPPLPPNPGRNPAEKRQYTDLKNEALEYTRAEYLTAHPQTGPMVLGITGPPPEELAARLAVLKRNPFQASLIPILRRQVAAEQKAQGIAQPGVAYANDVSRALLASLGGEIAAAGTAGLLARIPVVGALLRQPILGNGAAKALGRIGTRVGLYGTTGGVAGGAASSLYTALQLGEQGKSLGQAIHGGLKQFGPGFAFGGAVSAGLGLAGDVIGGLRGLPGRPVPPDGGKAVPPAWMRVEPGGEPGGGIGTERLRTPEVYESRAQLFQQNAAAAEAEAAAAQAAKNPAAAARAAPNTVAGLRAAGIENPTVAQIVQEAQRSVRVLTDRAEEAARLGEQIRQYPEQAAARAAAREAEQAAERTRLAGLQRSPADLPWEEANPSHLQPGERFVSHDNLHEIEILSPPDADGEVRIALAATPVDHAPGWTVGATRDVPVDDILFDYLHVVGGNRAPAVPATRTIAPPVPEPVAAPAESLPETTPGGYVQAPTGTLAGAHGPMIDSPTGVPVPLRLQTVGSLTGLFQALAAAGHPDARRVADFLTRADQYQRQQQPPLELLPEIERQYKDSPAQALIRALQEQATAQGSDYPNLADTLHRAATDLRKSFGESVAIAQPNAQEYDLGYPLAPVFAAPYRSLTGAERGLLTPAARRALLIQDIVNSTQVLHPGTPPFFAVPNAGNLGQLGRTADNLFQQAQLRSELSEVGYAAPAPNSPVAGRIVSGLLAGQVPLKGTAPPPDFSGLGEPLPLSTGAASVPVSHPEAPALSPRLKRVLKAVATAGRADQGSLRKLGLAPEAARQVRQELTDHGWLTPDGRVTISPAEVDRQLQTPEGAILPYAAGPLTAISGQRSAVSPEKVKGEPAAAPPAPAAPAPAPTETAPGRKSKLTADSFPASPLPYDGKAIQSRSGTVLRLKQHADGRVDGTVEVEGPGSLPIGVTQKNLNIEKMLAGPWSLVEAPVRKSVKVTTGKEKAAGGAAKPATGTEKPASPSATPSEKAAPRAKEEKAPAAAPAPETETETEAGTPRSEGDAPAKARAAIAALPEDASLEDILGAIPAPDTEPKVVAAPETEPEPVVAAQPARPLPAGYEPEGATAAEQEAVERAAAKGVSLPTRKAETGEGNVLASPATGKRVSAAKERQAAAARQAQASAKGFDTVAAGTRVKYLPTQMVVRLTAPRPQSGPYAWDSVVEARGMGGLTEGRAVPVDFSSSPGDWQLNPPEAEKKAPKPKAAPRTGAPDWAKPGVIFDGEPLGNRWRLESRDESGVWTVTHVRVAPESARMGFKPGRTMTMPDAALWKRQPVSDWVRPAGEKARLKAIAADLTELERLLAEKLISQDAYETRRRALTAEQAQKAAAPAVLAPAEPTPEEVEQIAAAPAATEGMLPFRAGDFIQDQENGAVFQIEKLEGLEPGDAAVLYKVNAETGSVVGYHNTVEIGSLRFYDLVERRGGEWVVVPPDVAHAARKAEPAATTEADDAATIEREVAAAFGRPAPEPKAKPAPKPAAKAGAPEPAPLDLTGRLGRETTVKAGNETVTVRYALVPVDELLTSNTDTLVKDPGYPAQFQPRDRTELASQVQVSEIERHLDPAQLGENYVAQHGAPIIAPSGVVEGGNGRTIALRRLYRGRDQVRRKNVARYQKWLAENLAGFGLDPALLSTVKQPVLVRVRTQAMDEGARVRFVNAINARETLAMGAVMNARQLAAQFTPELMRSFNPGADGELNVQKNEGWVRAVLSLVPPNEQGELYTEATGRVALSRNGLLLLGDALFDYAYGDAALLQLMATAPAESPAKNISNALARVAGHWALMRAGIADGTIYPLDITGPLMTAVNQFMALRERGETVDDYLDPEKPTLEEEKLTPFDKEILVEIDRRRTSSKALRTLLADYVDVARAAGNPIEDRAPALMEGYEKPEPTIRQVWEAAKLRSGPDEGRNPAVLFAESGGAARPAPGPRARGGAGNAAPEPGHAGGNRTQRRANVRLLARYSHAGGHVVDLDGQWYYAAPLKGARASLLIDPDAPFPVASARFLHRTAPVWRRVLHRFMRGMTPEERLQVGRFGFLLTPQRHLIYGLNYQADRDVPWHEIYLNPFLGNGPHAASGAYRFADLSGDFPGRVARHCALVLLHELAHVRVKESEGEELWNEMDRIREAMGDANWERGIAEITHALTGGRGADAGFSEEYRAGRAEYFAAARPYGSRQLHRERAGAAGAGPAAGHAVQGGVRQREAGAGGHPGAGGGAGRVSYAQMDPRELEDAQFEQAHHPEAAAKAERRLLPDARAAAGALTREYSALPQGAEYSQQRQLLTYLKRADGVGRQQTQIHLAQLLGSLTPKERRAYEMALYVADLAEDFQILKAQIAAERRAEPLSEEALQAEAERRWTPPELVGDDGLGIKVWTPERVAARAAELDQASGRIQAAVKARRSTVRDVADQLSYWMERATGRRRELTREEYFHHQVLAYALDPDAPEYQRVVASGSREVTMKARGFLRPRLGTTLAHNSSLIASELDWMPQALRDIQMYQAIAYARERFDVTPELKRIASAQNLERLLAHYEARFEKNPSLWKNSDPEKMMRSELNTGLAQAFEYFGYLADEGVLPMPPDGRFDGLIEELRDLHAANKIAVAEALENDLPIENARLDAEYGGLLFQYAQWLLAESKKAGEGLPGSGAAARLFKAATARQQRIRQILGRQHVTPEDVLSTDPRYKGKYGWWQPDRGRTVFKTATVPERIAEQLFAGLAQSVSVTVEDLGMIQALGAPKLRLALPLPLIHTLENLDEYGPKTPFDRVAVRGTQAIKMLQVFNPVHSIEFAIRKTITDAQAMALGDVKALAEWPGALAEVGAVMLGQRPGRHQEILHWMQRGGLQLNIMLGEELPNKAAVDFLQSLGTGGRFVQALKRPATYRKLLTLFGPEVVQLIDGSARYATYLAYLKILKGNAGAPRNYAYSDPAEVLSLWGTGRNLDEQMESLYRDRAWKLSNDLMVAYDEVPPALKMIADRSFGVVNSYLRWEQGNGRRWARRLLEPAWREHAGMRLYEALAQEAVREREAMIGAGGGSGPPIPPKPGGGGPGEPPEPPERGPLPRVPLSKSPRVLRNLAVVGAVAVGSVAIQRALGTILQNGELYRDLPPEERGKAPLILGVDPLTGKTMVYPRLNSFQETLKPLGLDNVWDWRGHLTPLEQVELHGRDLVQWLWNLHGPTASMVEAALGKSGYPSIFNPRDVKDRRRYVMTTLGLTNSWKYFEDLATRAPKRERFRILGVREYDRGESNYYEIRDKVRQNSWLGGGQSEKSKALYQAHQAAREGDLDGAAQFLIIYHQKGGDERGQRESLRNLDPLSGMNDHQAAAFARGLDKNDQARLKGALLYWKSFVDPLLHRPRPVRPAEMELPIERFVSRVRHEVIGQIRNMRPLSDAARRSPENRAAMQAADRALAKAKRGER